MLPRGEASVSSTAAAPPGHGRLLQSVSSTAHQGKATDAMPCHAMPCPTRGGPSLIDEPQPRRTPRID